MIIHLEFHLSFIPSEKDGSIPLITTSIVEYLNGNGYSHIENPIPRVLVFQNTFDTDINPDPLGYVIENLPHVHLYRYVISCHEIRYVYNSRVSE